MQPFLMLKHRLGVICKIHWSSRGHTGPVKVITLTGPVFFCKLLLNGATHDTKIDCIRLVWAGAKKYNFCYAQAL